MTMRPQRGPSLDLPEELNRLLQGTSVSENVPRAMLSPTTGTFDIRGPVIPMQQTGGTVMPEAGIQPPMQTAGIQPPMQTADMPQGPSNPTMVNSQVKSTASANPEMIARIRAGIEAGLESGEISTQELNMVVQLARAVMQNPAMYPQMRQLAIQRGIATEQDLPAQYDEGLIIAILTVGEALEADVQFNPQQTDMPEGGMLQGPSHSQGGIPVKAGGGLLEMEGGEFVIPKNVVQKKGTEFFEKMIKQYEEGGEVK